MIPDQHRKPVIHFFRIRCVCPMSEERRRTVQAQPLAGRMNLEGKGEVPGTDGPNCPRHEGSQSSWTEHRSNGSMPVMIEIQRNLCEKAQMVGHAERADRGKRMAIVQMEVHWFPECAYRLDQLEYRVGPAGHGCFDVPQHLREP